MSIWPSVVWVELTDIDLRPSSSCWRSCCLCPTVDWFATVACTRFMTLTNVRSWGCTSAKCSSSTTSLWYVLCLFLFNDLIMVRTLCVPLQRPHYGTYSVCSSSTTSLWYVLCVFLFNDLIMVRTLCVPLQRPHYGTYSVCSSSTTSLWYVLCVFLFNDLIMVRTLCVPLQRPHYGTYSVLQHGQSHLVKLCSFNLYTQSEQSFSQPFSPEKRRGLFPGGRFPPSFIHQVIIITGLNKLYNRMFSPWRVKMALDADWA